MIIYPRLHGMYSITMKMPVAFSSVFWSLEQIMSSLSFVVYVFGSTDENFFKIAISRRRSVTVLMFVKLFLINLIDTISLD